MLAADATDKYLLFAGSSTWAYAGGAWTQVSTSSPSPYAMTSDWYTGTVVAVAGSGCGEGCGVDTTWTYSAGSWTQVPPSGPVPPNGIYQRLAEGQNSGIWLEEATNHSAWLLTWYYDPETGTWTNLTVDGIGAAPTNRVGFSFSTDRTDSGVALFGGQAYNASLRATTPHILGDFWLNYGTGTWYNATHLFSSLPPGRVDAYLASDAPSDPAGDMVLFGGHNLTAAGVERTYSDTWVFYTPGGWTNMTAPMAPRSTQWPSNDGGLVLWAGTTYLMGGCYSPEGASVGSPCYLANETWTYPFTPGGPITVWISVSPSMATIGQTVFLNVTSVSGGTPPYSYTWRFGDGGTTPSHAQEATHVFNASGTFTVRVWVNDSFGNSGIGNTTEDIYAPLSVSISPSYRVTDVGVPTTFSPVVSGGSGLGSLTYAWVFGDGSTSSLGTHTYSSVGSYTVRLWVNDSLGGSATATASVLANPALSMCALTASPNPAYLGQLVTFNCSVSGGSLPYTYAWSFGDGGLGGNLSTITHVYETNGPFLAKVTVTDQAGVTAQASLNVSIALQVALTSSQSTLQVGGTAYVMPVVSGGSPPYTFSWPGLPSWCTIQGPTSRYPGSAECVPPSGGTFSISVTVQDSKGNLAHSTFTLVVNVPSSHSASPSPFLGLGGNEGYYLLAGVVIVAALVVAVVYFRRHSRGPTEPHQPMEPEKTEASALPEPSAEGKPNSPPEKTG